MKQGILVNTRENFKGAIIAVVVIFSAFLVVLATQEVALYFGLIEIEPRQPVGEMKSHGMGTKGLN